MLAILQAAGWPIWPLVACSILALALIIERFLKGDWFPPPPEPDDVAAGTISTE